MLDGNSSLLAHRLQNAILILLSISLLPLTTYIVILSYVYDYVFSSKVIRQRDATLSKAGFQPKTILITGVGMTKGLAIARLFHQAGHAVIGADFEPTNLPTTCGRVSKAISIFCRLAKPTPSGDSAPYIQSLLNIVKQHDVDLWVSCSGVASAVEDGEAKEIVESRTACRAIQFDIRTTQTLHEKHTFIAKTQDLGLTVPETRTVTSRKAVEDILKAAPKNRQYILKTIGVDDSVIGDMTLLPKSTPKQTSEHIARLKISTRNPWILQQFIRGREFCTHSLIIRGQVRAFVACPSAELLMHYTALPSTSPLTQAMLNFTRTYADSYGDTFTGHLSFDFLVEDADLTNTDVNTITLYPIECNPRAHTAVCLFDQTTEMVDAYLDLLTPPYKAALLTTDTFPKKVITPFRQTKDQYYWIGDDLTNLLILPVVRGLLLQIPPSESFAKVKEFMTHVLFWKDGTFEVWDPLPWWWLYHVYWPVQFAFALWQDKKWSRINVSTTKMFVC